MVTMDSAGRERFTSKLKRLNVYNQKDDSIGEITDIAMKNHQVDALILSVGSFLGLGEHYVAVSLSSVNVRYDEKNNKWLASMNTIQEALKAAPRLSSGALQVRSFHLMARLTFGHFLSNARCTESARRTEQDKHDIAYLYSETTTRKSAHPRRVLAYLRKDWTFASPRLAPRPLDQMAARIRRPRILQPHAPQRDAAYIYNHVQSAGMVVYLAEAAGLDTNVVQRAFRLATNTAGNNAAVTAAAAPGGALAVGLQKSMALHELIVIGQIALEQIIHLCYGLFEP